MAAKKQDAKTIKLAKEKLASSGLTMDDAETLCIDILQPAETKSLHESFKAVCAIKFNYLDKTGEPMPDWPSSPSFYRVRYLELPNDFSAITKKPVRYVQEPNTAPLAYFPGNQSWSEIFKDTDRPIIITEGELKAAKACKEGFPTIGLGGVYNWRSNKLGIMFLACLEEINWVRRNVYICFDSDYKTNVLVCNALHEFAEELHRRGAFTHLVSLPQLQDLEKTGLDDFLTFSGKNANEQFRQLLSDAEPLGLTQTLWGFNDRYVYVRNPGLIIDRRSRFKTSPSAFRDHLESTAVYQERSLDKNGNMSYRPVPASAAWLRWPLRLEASKITYAPGRDTFVNGDFNAWPGWGVEPKKGDVKPFLKLVDHVFTGAEPEAKKWFIQWCAYPLQYPGVKLYSSVVIHGIRHGTGKSLIGYSIGKIYGENFTEIAQANLHSSFNEWAECKQLVLGDDISGSNKRQDADLLKKMITQRELRINMKFVPSFVVPDCINYFFTANHPDAFFLEDDDRRYFVHEVQVPPMDEEFYMDYGLWLSTGGAQAIFQYLLDVDTGDFNPAAHAYRTAARDRMITNVQSDLGGWVRELITNPDYILKIGEIPLPSDLYTSKELLNLYDPTGRTGTTANGLGRELARGGVRQVCQGKPVRLADGSSGRYFAVRNQDSWLTKSYSAVADHLNKKRAKNVKF